MFGDTEKLRVTGLDAALSLSEYGFMSLEPTCLINSSLFTFQVKRLATHLRGVRLSARGEENKSQVIYWLTCESES